ncbi:MAG TPA: transcription antitermination factor NusB [Candidatus Baltobacteraceae bacterium]|jgi:16S rRNA (cytosine967-C5)-methyltransferase|nr:transcription antitermination factor NusB [Candidatus Baltobacteraceae bacterium]
MTAREIALHVVRDVFPAPGTGHSERTAQEALDYRLQRSSLDQRDRAFATQLAFGSIKMRRTLDWYLQPFVGTRAKALPPVIAEILRMAIYELRFTGSQPHAIVSQWVGLAKRYGHRGTAGLVNAVLRGFLRDDPSAPQREDFADEDDYLGTAFSFPTWLVRQWRGVFGADRLAAILEACNAPAQPAVTVNRAVATRETVIAWLQERGAQAAASELAQDSVLVSDGSLTRLAQAESDGKWWVQSESSSAVVDVLNPQPGEAVADVCSGRGSKALQSAARLHGDGTLTCVELDARRAALLERRAAQAGLAMAIVVGDATAPILEQRFDRVLIDAPCSGTGVVGRHPEARWKKRPEDGERLAHTQRALIEAALPRVFEGGALVYAVCSSDPRETTQIIDEFVRTQNVQRGLLPACFAPFETACGDVLIPPGLSGRDGFYIARLERRM